MKLYREKIIGLVVIVISFFSITSALNVKAFFWQDMFSAKDKNEEKSIFDISGLDSDSDGVSDKKEYELGTNPYNYDSDDDGYTDGEEVKAGFDPLKQEGNNLVDKDEDGLTGEDERKYKTDPNKADTDYDGYSDGFEILTGHDPLQADFSFLEPIIKKTESDNSSTSDTTSSSIEKILNVKNFSEVTPDSLASIGLDTSKIDLEKEIDFPEVPEEDVKVSDNTSQEFIQDYFNIIGIILYSNSPIHSMDEAESYAETVDIANSSQIKELEDIVLEIKGEFIETEVPNKPEFIEFHKQVLTSAITLQGLFNSLENMDFQGNNAFYEVMNLLPQFSSLNDYIFDKVYPRAQELAEENGVELPSKAFLEQHQ